MAETPNEGMQEAAKLAAAARDRGIEHLEGAKGQLAEGAERVAAAVERTAEELDGEQEGAISGFGHSVASLMRQLAGGLRERDVEAFAQELGSLARRNPGVFLAGSVALGFGIARFFKARAPQSHASYDEDWQSESGWQGRGQRDRGGRDDVYSEEALDLSTGSTQRGEVSGGQHAQPPSSAPNTASAQRGDSPADTTATVAGDDDSTKGKSRQSGKQKVKPQRASSGGEPSSPPANERPSTGPASGGAGSSDSTFTGGNGGGALRGGKS